MDWKKSMTKAERDEVIDSMRMTDKEREMLKRRCDKGDASSLFAVYGWAFNRKR